MRALRAALSIVAIALVTRAVRAQTCAVTAECDQGRRCIRNTCIEPTQKAKSEREREDSNASGPYVSAALGTDLPATLSTVGEGFQLAVRFGYLLDRAQFQLEVAPHALLNLAPSPIGAVDAVATIAYFAEIGDMVSWILRLGGGGGFLFPAAVSGDAAAFAELRLDVFGVAIRPSRHLLLEFNAPSFRLLYFPTFGSFGTMWVTNVTVGYVF